MRFHLPLLCVGVALASAAVARPDLNAFLNKKATSVQALVSQVKSDPEVMDRYRRHYAMSSSEVLAFLSQLRTGQMLEETVFTVYSVPPDGKIKMRYAKLRKGSPVFTDMFGAPVLVAKCGNPLTRGPKSPVAQNGVPERLQRNLTEPRDISPDVDLPFSDEVLVMVPGVEPVPAEIVTNNQSPVTILPAAVGFPPLWPLIGIPFAFVKTDSDEGPPPIPEPGTLAVLVTGFGVAVARRKRTNA